MRKALQKIIFSLILSPQIWGDEFIEDIKTRIEELISEKEKIFFSEIPDPFFRKIEVIEIEKNILEIQEPKQQKLQLEKIFNEKVKISGNWFFLNSFCQDYKIAEIGKDFVKLINSDEVKILKLPKRNRFLN